MVAVSDATRKLTIAVATDEDRSALYRLRHQVYASELGQHPENSDGTLTDPLDSCRREGGQGDGRKGSEAP